MKDIYPLTIVLDRYNGTYSGGKYTAWNLCPDEVPEDISLDDVSVRDFFQECNIPYGIGSTPNEAITDLATKLS